MCQEISLTTWGWVRYHHCKWMFETKCMVSQCLRRSQMRSRCSQMCSRRRVEVTSGASSDPWGPGAGCSSSGAQGVGYSSPGASSDLWGPSCSDFDASGSTGYFAISSISECCFLICLFKLCLLQNACLHLGHTIPYIFTMRFTSFTMLCITLFCLFVFCL